MANSTTKAEYIAASNCCGQVLWLQNQLLDYGYNFMKTQIHVDNESAIYVVKNLVYHSKTKHIEIRHHFIRDSYEKKLIEMVKIHTDYNVADLLTKDFNVTRKIKIGRDTKVPQSGGPLTKVGDEAVHKELGDRMERAATTASSFKAGHDSATYNTNINGEVELTASIYRQAKTITEASLRRHLKLEDKGGIISLPNTEIFEQLALIGYATDSDKLTFQKGNFSPQWRFFIHTILHCLSPKKTSWEQFSSNIATAIICLATNKTFNFLKFIFDAMVKNLDNPHKFLMYPRFIQICLNKQRRLLKTHTRTYPTPVLTQKVFNNMKRVTRGYSGDDIPLFSSMITAPDTSPSRIMSSPSLSPQHTPVSAPSTSPPPITETLPTIEEPALIPHESPLQSVHSLGRDEGSVSLNELMDLVTQLTNKVGGLENELKNTKKVYGTAITKLAKRVKKLEMQVKTGKASRRIKIVLSEDEVVEEDSSK
ncbi:hypothetical protein Tco_0436776 [Tanacetum coccineum]